MKCILYFLVLSFTSICKSNSIDSETIMLVQLRYVESGGSKTSATIVLFNESTRETLTLRARTSNVSKISLKPGIYSLDTYFTYGGVEVNLDKIGYKFEIKPNEINYVGDWLFTENWSEFMSKYGKVGVSFETSFSKVTIENGFAKYPDLFKSLKFNVAKALISE